MCSFSFKILVHFYFFCWLSYVYYGLNIFIKIVCTKYRLEWAERRWHGRICLSWPQLYFPHKQLKSITFWALANLSSCSANFSTLATSPRALDPKQAETWMVIYLPSPHKAAIAQWRVITYLECKGPVESPISTKLIKAYPRKLLKEWDNVQLSSPMSA